MPNDANHNCHDASIHVWCESPEDSELSFKFLCRLLVNLGFKVGKDPHIEKNYKELSKTHRFGQHGDLKCKLNYYPAGFEVEFYQDLVHENPHGGFYDFNKLRKMPYLVRLRFILTKRKILEWLDSLGYRNTSEPDRRSCSLLDYFNYRWDMPSDKKSGVHRFRRGDDGWPAESELNHWNRYDVDGNILNHGQTKYIIHDGRAMRCTVWGGVNGMWWCVYGPGETDMAARANWEIYDEFPGRGRLFKSERRIQRMEQELKKKVDQRDYLGAHHLSKAVERYKSCLELV